MKTKIIKLLNQKKLTIDDIANKSGISKRTLQDAYKKTIDNWEIRVLNAFATGLEVTPAELLNMLQPVKYELKIDNSAQTIQSVYIADKQTFQNIRFTVEMEHMEGWKPTREDIEYLLNEIKIPDTKIEAQIEKMFGE
ncbi:MAG: helix-turn-helix domain-containing protein [Lactobacillus sp.]